jgi:hypothetical protein
VISVISLGMIAFSHAEKHKWTSPGTTIQILITFSRRISVHEGVIGIISPDFFRSAVANRAWISSSISLFTETYFSQCKSLTSVTFESNSKLHRIEESAFAGSGLLTIQIPASVEVVRKSCFAKCSSFISVTFESNSKLQRIDESAFQESGLLTIPASASIRSSGSDVSDWRGLPETVTEGQPVCLAWRSSTNSELRDRNKRNEFGMIETASCMR